MLIVTYLKTIYDQYVTYKADKLYYLNFTGQLMYVEKHLQDAFSCTIYIDDGTILSAQYLFNKEEIFLPVYMGNNFVLGQIYEAGNEIIYNNIWYSYDSDGDGTEPDKDAAATEGLPIETMLVNKTELVNNVDFIVYIPDVCYNAMTTDDLNRLNAIIKYYKLFDKSYEIKTY